MAFARKVWKLLVGIKDGLVLIFMLLFFGLLFAALSARPAPGQVREGALLLDLDGVVVEERSAVDPLSLLSGSAPVAEYPVRDLVRAIDAAAADERIGAIALDLTTFLGGGQVHMQEIGAALDRARTADKRVLTYAIAYADDSMLLAAHADEVWVDPLGGALVAGPGGDRLYYAGLLDRFNVNARVYRVGTYKSAVEPWIEREMSPAARENYTALYGALWEEYQANVRQARPKAQLDRVTSDPVAWVASGGGDLSRASLAAGLVDKLGSRVDFGERVAEIVGEDDWDETPGAFPSTDFDTFLAAHPDDSDGDAIGVVTIAGQIVDGEAGPGVAGGERIAKLLDDALGSDLKALVVRVDSPGGSVLASEEIRRAILRHKAKDIPVAVSMANLAASGGYWVATPADRIFAEPETVTGSIGVFGIVPTFEGTLADYGVNSDGVRTTPLSGQPDVLGGFTPEVDAILQANVEDVYTRFLGLVAKSRGKSPQAIDTIAQGRVWDGGSARQLGLVDQFGGLDAALEWAAAEAGLEEGEWHARYLRDPPDPTQELLRSLLGEGEAKVAATDLFGTIAARQDAVFTRVDRDLEMLLGTRGVQAHCLECPVVERPASKGKRGMLARLIGFFVD